MSEIRHIIHLLMVNHEEGWYSGNKEQYWQRHKSILDKLLN